MDEIEEETAFLSDSLDGEITLENENSEINEKIEEKYFKKCEDHEIINDDNFKTDYQVLTFDETIEPHSIYDNYQPDDEDICEILDERNILLLGQVGVGKSTFINSLANFLKFKDFQSALHSELELPCACDSDEEVPVGAAGCHVHEIRHGSHLLRIFDTYGLGDTRGEEQDKVNLEETFNVLSQYEELHCIVIVLKANQSQLTATFRYALKRFLFQLPKNAVEHIVFLFTHSRETFFKPGDTAQPLRAIVQGIAATPPHVTIPLGPRNMFCVDNEAFKFLLAFQNGGEMSEVQRAQYGKSWERSEKEALRMLHLITGSGDGRGMRAYAMDDFLCVANVRRAVDELRGPLVQTMDNILDNIKLLNAQSQEIRNCGNDQSQLREVLGRPVVRFRVKELVRPRVVCASEKCVKNYRVNNTEKTHFAQVCCEPCDCPPEESSSADKIGHCVAFAQTGSCIKCGCSSAEHKQMYYETVIEQDESTSLITNSNILEAAKQSAEQLRWKAEKLSEEKEKLIKHAAKLAVFLRQNAIFPHNDTFEATFSFQIQCEQMLMKGGWGAPEVAESLEQMLSAYRKQVEIIQGTVGVEEVLRTIHQLYLMESCGEVLAVAIQAKIKDGTVSSNGRWIKFLAGMTTGVGLVGLAGALVFAPPLVIPAALLTAPAALATAWIFLKGLWTQPPALTQADDVKDTLKSISTSHSLIYMQ